jgi:hypothetical protein
MAISIAPVSARTSVPFTQCRAGEPERPHGRSLTALRVQAHRAMPSRLGEDGLLVLPSSEDLAGALPLGSSVPSSRFLRGMSGAWIGDTGFGERNRSPVGRSSSPRWSGDHRRTLVNGRGP